MAAVEDVGFCITEVIAGRQAEALGTLHVGDIITHVDGTSIAGIDIRDVLQMIGAGARFAPVASCNPSCWHSVRHLQPIMLALSWASWISFSERVTSYFIRYVTATCCKPGSSTLLKVFCDEIIFNHHGVNRPTNSPA
jgi:hypothetical protein